MHVIRLKRPWTKTDIELGISERVDVPDSTLGDERSINRSDIRTVSYTRKFNLPSGLDDSRVWLRISSWQGIVEAVRINEQSIGDINADELNIEVDITRHLQPHNRLEIVLANQPPLPPRLTGEVTLAIAEDGESLED